MNGDVSRAGNGANSARSGGWPQSNDSPALVAVCGLPGVGKSTVAEFITDSLGGTRIRTDAVRTDLFENPQYTSQEKESVYGEILDRARATLADGQSVILDATFARRERRLAVSDLAGECGVPFCLVKVVCDQSVAEQRIAEREGISDAGVETHREYRDVFEPVELDHVTIDNSRSISETRDQVDALLV